MRRQGDWNIYLPGLVGKYSIHSEQHDRIKVLSVPNSTQLFFQRWKSKVIFQEAHFPLNNHDGRKSQSVTFSEWCQ